MGSYEFGPDYVDNNGNVVSPSDAVTLCDLYIEQQCVNCPISGSCPARDITANRQ